MRIFEKPNVALGWKCPICGTAEEKKIVLIPKANTGNGKICEAEQVHLDCLLDNLTIYDDFIALRLAGG